MSRKIKDIPISPLLEKPALKPCPFCGSIPNCGVEFYSSCGAEVKLSAVVECSGCGIRKINVFKATDNITFVSFYDYDNAFEKVIEEWNKRVGEQE